MAFHKRASNNVVFGSLNLKEGIITVPVKSENGIKVIEQVESISGYVTRIDTRRSESTEYGVSEDMTIYFHDSTSLFLRYSSNDNVSYKAAHLIGRLLSVAISPGGFSNEIAIRAGSFPAGHRFSDGRVLDREQVWTSVRVPAISDSPITPYYGKDKVTGQPMEKLPETPARLDTNGREILHQGRPLRDHTELKAWVDSAVGFLKACAEKTADQNRQKTTRTRATRDDESFDMDPATIAAADAAANMQQSAPSVQPVVNNTQHEQSGQAVPSAPTRAPFQTPHF